MSKFKFEKIVQAEPHPQQIEYDKWLEEQAERRRNEIPSPGPWDYEDTYDSCCGSCCTVDGCHESHESGQYYVIGPDFDNEAHDCRVNNKADARLMAAAPDLLDACELALEVIRVYDEDGDEVNAVHEIEKAIAQAKEE